MPDLKIPKNIHYVVVGPIKDWELTYLKIWTKVNPHHKIYVSAPSDLIYQRILYSLLFSERIKQTIETDYPANIAQLRLSIWQKIDAFMSRNTAIGTMDIMNGDFSDSVKRSFITQWTKTNHILNQIKTSIENVVIRRHLSNFEKGNSEYIRHTLSLKKTLTTERLIGLFHEFNLGGVYIDKGILPRPKVEIIPRGSSSFISILGEGLSWSDREQLERAIIRTCLEKMFADGIIPDPGTYFKGYDINLSQEEYNLVKNIVETNSITNLFDGLKQRDLTDSTRYKVFFGREFVFKEKSLPGYLDDSIQPTIFESRKNNPFIGLIIKESLFFYNTLEALKKDKTRKEERIPRIKSAMTKFYKDHDVTVSDVSISKAATMLSELSYNNGNFDHQIFAKLGYDAFDRLRRMNIKRRPTIINTYDLSVNSPFYDINSYAINYDLPEIVPQRPYENLIIINVPKIRDNMVESLRKCYEHYNKYRTQDGRSVLYNIVNDDTNVLYNVFNDHTKETLRLEVISGKPFRNIGEDTKVFITGSIDFSDIKSNDIYPVYSRSLVRKLSSVLSLTIPKDTNLQSIAFSFDNSAQNIPDYAGVLDASQKDYIVPEVLRELAKKGIRANSAVAVRGYLSAGVPRQTTGDDPARPSTSGDTLNPELNRIVFTLNNDNTVAYTAKFGLDSLDPENEFYARPKIDIRESTFTDQLFESIIVEDPQGSVSPEIQKAVLENLVERQRIIEDDLFGGITDRSTFAAQEGRLLDNIVDYRLAHPDQRKDAQKFTLSNDFQAAIFYGLVEQPATENVAFVHPDERETNRLKDTLRLALESSSYTDWLARYASRFTAFNLANQLEREMHNFQTEEAKARAFENLKRRIEARSYYIYNVDPTTAEGAAELNAEFKNDFDNVDLLTAQPPGYCNRRRRSADANSCNARRK
uniref:hypothetical protein n=2 Tax=unclassified Endozoicomonas TaxID=2644528 RepID=UPI002148E366